MMAVDKAFLASEFDQFVNQRVDFIRRDAFDLDAMGLDIKGFSSRAVIQNYGLADWRQRRALLICDEVRVDFAAAIQALPVVGRDELSVGIDVCQNHHL